MRYRLRTLLIVLALGPPLLAAAWIVWSDAEDAEHGMHLIVEAGEQMSAPAISAESITFAYRAEGEREVYPSNRDLLQLAKAKNLRSIAVTGPEIDDAGIASLAALDKLEYVSLGGCGVSDGSVKILSRLPRLKQLDLSDTKITDDGLKALSRCRKLEVLDVSGTRIRGHGFAALADVPLRELDCSRTAITGRGVWSIARIRTLELVQLMGTGQTVGELESLSSLPALKNLVLPRLSDDLIMRCKRELPKVNVIVIDW